MVVVEVSSFCLHLSDNLSVSQATDDAFKAVSANKAANLFGTTYFIFIYA